MAKSKELSAKSNHTSNSLSPMLHALSNNKIILGILLFSFLGFLDATYLTLKHLQGTVPPCTISGCETVLSSVYASIGPIPLAAVGAAFYLALLILTMLTLTEKKHYHIWMIFVLATGGLLASIVLIGLQAFIIKAFCLYCLFSEAMNLLIFLVAFIEFRKVYEVKKKI